MRLGDGFADTTGIGSVELYLLSLHFSMSLSM
jgi:hypothetical protein